jgi:Plasma-membrane choline transporter
MLNYIERTRTVFPFVEFSLDRGCYIKCRVRFCSLCKYSVEPSHFILTSFSHSLFSPAARHVTTAGTVGTFWFEPIEANGCCSKAVRDSYVRSITTSFGSICFGSLVVAIINTVRDFVRSSRENGDSFVACCADCLLGCLEDLVEYFNKWAYVYVGLYGFGFMDAGANVMTLFRNRGWTSIIADVMVDTLLRLLSIAVALFTGLIFVLITYLLVDNDALEQGGSYIIGVLAVFPVMIGYLMAITVFSVIGSAVNTVIVCYAEAPNEFQTNHPLLSERMTDAWRRAYPDHLDH